MSMSNHVKPKGMFNQHHNHHHRHHHHHDRHGFLLRLLAFPNTRCPGSLATWPCGSAANAPRSSSAPGAPQEAMRPAEPRLSKMASNGLHCWSAYDAYMHTIYTYSYIYTHMYTYVSVCVCAHMDMLWSHYCILGSGDWPCGRESCTVPMHIHSLSISMSESIDRHYNIYIYT